jgi:hypothetical protein
MSFRLHALAARCQRDLRNRPAFRHKESGRAAFGRTDIDMGWTARIVIAVIVLLVAGAAVLGFYESTRPPPQHVYETAVPVSSGQ